MVFSDISTAKSGLIQKCEYKLFGDNGYGRISGDPSLLATFTNLLNDALDWYTMTALRCDSNWQFDDSNYTDYPIATTSLIQGQQDYILAVEHIQITSLEVLLADGSKYNHVAPITDKEIIDMGKSVSEYKSTQGPVQEYRKVANSIFLHHVPDYSIAQGIKIRFERPQAYFSTTDTTKKPGFASTHHVYLADYACATYAVDRGMANAKDLYAILTKRETVDIPAMYTRRAKDMDNTMRPKWENNK